MITQSRASKQLGDFGEGLVTYALIRKGFEVAVVDHVGADLIAEKSKTRFAISVKTRMFKSKSKESLNFVATKDHLDKLDYFAKQFGNMTPLFALAVSIVDENAIHLIISKTDDIRKNLPDVKNGYSFRFAKSTRQKLITEPFIDYSCWEKEIIGNKEFA